MSKDNQIKKSFGELSNDPGTLQIALAVVGLGLWWNHRRNKKLEDEIRNKRNEKKKIVIEFKSKL